MTRGEPTAGPAEAEAGGLLTIDLGAVAANWRELAQRAAPAECGAAVKADAYGLGLEPVVRALAAAGCRTFFVAYPFEGREVRAAAPGATVYVLNGLFRGTAPAYTAGDLRPVLCSLEEIDEWQAFCAASGWSGGAAVQVDTGMNRLGLDQQQTAALAARSPQGRAGITLMMSHLACSEDAAHPLNGKQIGRSRVIRQMFPDVPFSLANSSGIFLGPDALHDLVRPGVALYGANPTPSHVNPMRPVLRLAGRIVQVRTVAAGETVGYGAAWTAKRPSRIAIVSIGYADGLFRSAGSTDRRTGAETIVAGHRCPVAGRISMDLLALDVTGLAAGTPRRGAWAEFLNDEIGVDALAAHAGTIAYEILTGLGRRFRRTYLE